MENSMAEELKPKATKEPKKILVQPVYGLMVNLITGQRFDGITELTEIDGWTQAQIDAGKIQLV